jgi:hypothetical protein
MPYRELVDAPADSFIVSQIVAATDLGWVNYTSSMVENVPGRNLALDLGGQTAASGFVLAALEKAPVRHIHSVNPNPKSGVMSLEST